MISQCWGWDSEEIRRGAVSAGVANVTKTYKCTGSWVQGRTDRGMRTSGGFEGLHLIQHGRGQ